MTSPHESLPDEKAAFLSAIADAIVSGAFQKALTLADTALERWPDDPSFLLRRGRVLRRLKRYDESIAVLTGVLERKPSRAVRFSLARTYRDAGDHSAQLAQLEAILAKRPDDAKALAPALAAAVACGDHPAVLRHVETALKHRPDDTALLLRRGRVLRRLKRYDESIAVLTEVLSRQPSRAVRLSLARAHRDAGDHRARLEQLEVILAKRPDDTKTLDAALVSATACRDYPAVLRHADAALEHRPADCKLLLQRGVALCRLQRHDESIVALSAVLDHEPSRIVRLELARAFGAMGDHSASLEQFEAILACHPDDRTAQAGAVTAMKACRTDDDFLAQLRQLHTDAINSLDPGRRTAAAQGLAKGITLVPTHLVATELTDKLGALAEFAGTFKPILLWQLFEICVHSGRSAIAARFLNAILGRRRLSAREALFLVRKVHAIDGAFLPRLEAHIMDRVASRHRPRVRMALHELTLGGDCAVSQRTRSRHGRDIPEIILLATLLHRSGRTRVAARYLALARRQHPEDAQILRRLIDYLLVAGAVDQAKAVIDEAAANGDISGDRSKELLANMYIQKGNSSAALSVLDDIQNNTIRKRLELKRVKLNLRSTDQEQAQKAAAEARSNSALKGGLHFNPTLLGLEAIELRLANIARDSGPRSMDGSGSQFLRSSIEVIESWVQLAGTAHTRAAQQIPEHVVQYWDSGEPPPALSRIMDSWKESAGARYEVFDRSKAIAFLKESLGPEWSRALGMTRHPAEQSDYFRLCYLLVNGGIYADCDDKLLTTVSNIVPPFSSLAVVREPFGAISNNLVMAVARHPIIAYAALSAKRAILARDSDSIWAKTGPGLLTRAVAWGIENLGNDGVAGLRIVERYKLGNDIQFHVRLPYKRTSTYWNAKVSETGGPLLHSVLPPADGNTTALRSD